MRKKYLITYNFLLAIGWSALLGYWLLNGRVLDRGGWGLLTVCQLAAALEVMHAGLNWVKTPVFTCLIQVSSRIFVLLLMLFLPGADLLSFVGLDGIALILIAWSITEIVRYSYYFANLIERPWSVLTYLRYTLFLVLYPLGVTGEVLIIVAAILAVKKVSVLLAIALGLVLLSYVYFFPKMYQYMLGQRKLKLVESSW